MRVGRLKFIPDVSCFYVYGVIRKDVSEQFFIYPEYECIASLALLARCVSRSER
jgi:hypothetical protein